MDRRNFLKIFGIGCGTAGALASGTASVPAASVVPKEEMLVALAKSAKRVVVSEWDECESSSSFVSVRSTSSSSSSSSAFRPRR